MELATLARWIHVMAGSMWLGEVVVINFILVPVMSRLANDGRHQFLAAVFPKVFRLASILAGTALAAGLTLVYLTYSNNWAALWANTPLLIGIAMGLLLISFHFFMEDKLARRVGIGNPDTPPQVLDDVHVKLKVVPRIGLAVISTIFLLMMIGARGI